MLTSAAVKEKIQKYRQINEREGSANIIMFGLYARTVLDTLTSETPLIKKLDETTHPFLENYQELYEKAQTFMFNHSGYLLFEAAQSSGFWRETFSLNPSYFFTNISGLLRIKKITTEKEFLNELHRLSQKIASEVERWKYLLSINISELDNREQLLQINQDRENALQDLISFHQYLEDVIKQRTANQDNENKGQEREAKSPIRVLVIDVDGVIVGNKAGFNFPDPHPEVIEELRSRQEAGIVICLCTGKPRFAIEGIIEAAGLKGIHITDGGSTVTHSETQEVISSDAIENSLARRVAEFYYSRGLYLEVYTPSTYFIWQEQQGAITDKHALTLKKYPETFADREAFFSAEKIVKLFLIATNEEEKILISQTFAAHFSDSLTLTWAFHPNTLPWQFGLITVKGVTKQKGIEILAEKLGVGMDEILGIGDGLQDWDFMQLCGRVATLANAPEEVRNLVRSKGEENSFVTEKGVNENGILEILEKFLGKRA